MTQYELSFQELQDIIGQQLPPSLLTLEKLTEVFSVDPIFVGVAGRPRITTENVNANTSVLLEDMNTLQRKLLTSREAGAPLIRALEHGRQCTTHMYEANRSAPELRLDAAGPAARQVIEVRNRERVEAWQASNAETLRCFSTLMKKSSAQRLGATVHLAVRLVCTVA